MPDISEFIYGDEYTAKIQAFETAMEAIEVKHQAFFESRKPLNETEPHDRLHHHYALTTASGQVAFRFNEGSDLPASLKQECLDAFHRIWKEWE